MWQVSHNKVCSGIGENILKRSVCKNINVCASWLYAILLNKAMGWGQNFTPPTLSDSIFLDGYIYP
jgi:hypothetical protein